MPYIHELTGWPNFTWDAEALAGPLAQVRHDQGRLLGKMLGLGFDLREEASLVVLTADVVKSSAIEGESLDPDEVRSSIARRLGLEAGGLPHSSRRVDGVVEMTLDATRRFSDELTEQRLFRWHAGLIPSGHSGMNSIAVGTWRPVGADPMRVVSGPIGREQIHFESPPAARLAQEMNAFLGWLRSATSIDLVLKAGIAHFWFVTVHPFEDGNGRIARAIADMVLARADGVAHRFYSMSAQIEAERKQYYHQLERAQRGELDITNWLLWFLECLGRAIASSDERLAGVLHKARVWERVNRRPVNERQRLVLNRLLGDFEGFLTSSKYAKLAKCSSDTALRDIRELLDRGVLVQNPARGRSTSYRVADPDEMSE